ncbi:MAG: 6-phosphofructokinase, partial [Pseudoflavonifractor sp.]
LGERPMPEHYRNGRGNDVTEAFTDWCRPLIGGALPEMAKLH